MVSNYHTSLSPCHTLMGTHIPATLSATSSKLQMMANFVGWPLGGLISFGWFVVFFYREKAGEMKGIYKNNQNPSPRHSE